MDGFLQCTASDPDDICFNLHDLVLLSSLTIACSLVTSNLLAQTRSQKSKKLYGYLLYEFLHIWQVQ